MVSRAAYGALILASFVSAFIPSNQRAVNSRRPPKEGRCQHPLLQTSVATPLEMADSTLPSVALVLPIGVRNTTARGSGFVIDWKEEPDCESDVKEGERYLYLLTAAHVALPGYRIQVVFCSNPGDDEAAAFSARVIGRDTHSDLALLQVSVGLEFIPPPPLTLSNHTMASIGTRVYSMGYPSGGVVGPAMTSGIVCGNALGLVTSSSTVDALLFRGKNERESGDDADAANDKKTRYIVTDSAMAGGMSGGPLVDAHSGTVLGINALINTELRALGNYAISAAECMDFLGMIDSKKNHDGTKGDVVYQVVLYNDRFNKRQRVQELLENVAKLNSTVSNRVMMDAHTTGRGVVKEFNGEDVEAIELCDALREEDLLVELETA